MNTLPRAVLGAAAGVAVFIPLHDKITPAEQQPGAVAYLQHCASLIGQQAVSATEVMAACDAYKSDFTPTSVTGPAAGKRSIVFSLPSQIDLLSKELPGAGVADQETIKHNADNRAGAIALAGFAGLITAFVVGANPLLKRAKVPTLHRSKNATVTVE